MLVMWVGKYQSDISYTNNYFDGSITYYGNGLENNFFCCPCSSRDYSKKVFIEFVVKKIKKYLNEYYFYFYNQSYAYEVIALYPESQKKIININSKELIEWLSNKTLSRLWVKNIIKVPPFCAVPGNECTYTNLKSLFPNYNKFVIQENFSAGGSGSHIIENKTNNDVLFNSINPQDIYLVSPLLENSYSVNLHVLIGKSEQIVLPVSIQVIEPNKSPFLFRGSDFIAAKKIPQVIIDELIFYARKIAEKLANIGYRGVCGLDFIIEKNNIYFLEINPRFQGSSFLLNRALLENNLPSLYELNDRAFRELSFKKEQSKLENLDINYSFCKIKHYNNKNKICISNYLNCPDVDVYLMDGLNAKSIVCGYLFRFISTRNIVSLNPNGQINIYQNLLMNEVLNVPLKSNEDWTDLKSLLLIQGVKINSIALKAIENLGGVQEGVFDAVDIKFSNNLVVNCPQNMPFLNFSPFTLCYSNNKFELCYFQSKIDNVTIDYRDAIPSSKTHSGLLYSKMIQRNNDRIRIRHNSVCCFKQNGLGCIFCHTKNEKKFYFDIKDIEESFLFYINNIKFNRIMIGGASNDRTQEAAYIKEILTFVRKYTDKSIYIMSIPPVDPDDIVQYKKLGANEIAFNIEVFDQKIAQKLMPGKGKISRVEYLEMLSKAVDVFGNKGKVRSMLIVGLEPIETFKVGIESLCQIGVSPMLTPFRPMQNTKLECFVPSHFNECKNYIEAALKITDKYNIELGPIDISSRNNTFNIVVN